MTHDDRTLLRLHIEAVWNIQLPSIVHNEIDIPANSNQPPWSLYIAQVANERISIWHSEIDASTRQSLLKRAEDALTHSVQADEGDIEREVAFKFMGHAKMTLEQAQQLAHPLTPDNYTQVDAFQPEAATYFFKRVHAPLFGTIQDGRLVSIAHSSRRTLEACELGIETLPEARRRRYALAATILWTHEVQREHLIPLYSALTENLASRALAEAAGYHLFARGLSITNLP